MMMERRRRSRWLLLPLLALATACSGREGPASEAQIARVVLNTGYEVKSAHAVRTDHETEAYYVTAIISRPEPRGDTAVTFLMMGPRDAPTMVLIANSVPEGALR